MSPTAFTPTIGKATQKAQFHYSVSDTTVAPTMGSGWNTVPFNETVQNEVPGLSLSSNQFILPAGTYRIKASASAYYGETHKLRLRNITGASTILVGKYEYTAKTVSDTSQTRSEIDEVFLLSDTTTVELQHYIEAYSSPADGNGAPPASGEENVYNEIILEREIPAVNDGNGEYVRGPMVHYKDVQPSATSGGTFTSGSWQTRTLNTDASAAIVGASRSGNDITLPAGSYYVEASAQAYRPNGHQIRLQNTTDASTAVLGNSENAQNTQNESDTAELSGQFTIGSPKVFQLQHRGQTTHASNGFGVGLGFGSDNIYAQVRIWKLVRAGVVETDETTKPLLHVREEQANGVSGHAGATFTASVWQTRFLNTIKTNEITNASVSGNTITLPAGTYRIEANAPAYYVQSHKAKLRDTGAGACLLYTSDAADE